MFIVHHFNFKWAKGAPASQSIWFGEHIGRQMFICVSITCRAYNDAQGWNGVVDITNSGGGTLTAVAGPLQFLDETFKQYCAYILTNITSNTYISINFPKSPVATSDGYVFICGMGKN